MKTADIKYKIDKNREEINNILFKDWPLDLIYIRIKMLSGQNERLILKPKEGI